MTFVPPRIETPRTDSDDPRLGHLLGRSCSAETAAVVIVGFPSDEGVRINGGRPGSAEAPQRIRERFYRMTPDARAPERFRHLLEHTADLGDVEVTGEVERDQERLGEALAPCLQRGAVPIILGGGHETAFGHFLAHVYGGNEVNVVNWDAHPDVRPLVDGRAHSGSPFRQVVEHGSRACRRYSVYGLSPHQTAYAHVQYVLTKGGQVEWAEDLTSERIERIYAQIDGPAMVSFDMDAVDQTPAPGVSAPNAAGLSPAVWLRAAEEAGRCPAVASFDLVEMNPKCDPDGRTARLGALTVWTILRGLSERAPAE